VRHVLSENPVTGFAAALFAMFVLMALFGPMLVPFDPLASNATAALQPPNGTHWFGTDSLGRDIFSRVVVATRLDLGIAVSAVAVSFAIGMPLGLAAGFFGGWWDRLVTRLSDTIMAFPLFVLAMGIVAALGNTVGTCRSTSAWRVPKPMCGATPAGWRPRACRATATCASWPCTCFPTRCRRPWCS
jgi:peptide/nickel transport system permease protein